MKTQERERGSLDCTAGMNRKEWCNRERGWKKTREKGFGEYVEDFKGPIHCRSLNFNRAYLQFWLLDCASGKLELNAQILLPFSKATKQEKGLLGKLKPCTATFLDARCHDCLYWD